MNGTFRRAMHQAGQRRAAIVDFPNLTGSSINRRLVSPRSTRINASRHFAMKRCVARKPGVVRCM